MITLSKRSRAACVVGALLIALTGCGSSDDSSSPGAGITAVASDLPQPGASLPAEVPSAPASVPAPSPTTKVVAVIDKKLYPEVGDIYSVMPQRGGEGPGDKDGTLVCNPENFLPVELKLDDAVKTIYGTPIRAKQSGEGDKAQTTISAIGTTSPYAVIVNGTEKAQILPEDTSAVTERLLITLDSKDWAGSAIKDVVLCVGAQ